MQVCRKIGSDLEDRECAKFIAAEAYGLANKTLADLLGSFAKSADIPASLKISDMEPGGWHGAEVAIDQAVNRGDWPETLRLCSEYLVRVNRFCATWKQRIQTEVANV